MKTFYLLLLLTLFFVTASAQNNMHKMVITKSTITTTPLQPPLKQYTPSGLIPVKAGEVIEVQPNITLPRKQHRFLLGIAKTLGIGALTYHANKKLQPGSNSKFGSNNANPGILPAVGLGLAAGLPDIIKGIKKQPQPFLKYYFYNKNRVLISQEVRQLNKKHKPILQPVTTDGFVQVVLVGALDARDTELEIGIKPKRINSTNGNLLGGVANTMNLQTYGECNNGGDGGGDDDQFLTININGIDYHFCDGDGNGKIDYLWYVQDGLMVLEFLQEPHDIAPEDFPVIMEGYDPEVWDSVDVYLNWYEENLQNVQTNPIVDPKSILDTKLPGFFNQLSVQVKCYMFNASNNFSYRGWTVNAQGRFTNGSTVVDALTLPMIWLNGNGLTGTITYYSPYFSTLPKCQQQALVAHESVHVLLFNLFWADNVSDPAKFAIESEFAAYTYQMQLATLNGDLATKALCAAELLQLTLDGARGDYVSFNPPLPASPTPC